MQSGRRGFDSVVRDSEKERLLAENARLIEMNERLVDIICRGNLEDSGFEEDGVERKPIKGFTTRREKFKILGARNRENFLREIGYPNAGQKEEAGR